MLVEHSSPTFEQLVETLSMRIQLTDGLRETLNSERGATSPNPFELRSAARFRCCGKCIVTISPLSFRMSGQEPQSMAIVRDISRKGIGLITHQQWYPEQLLMCDESDAFSRNVTDDCHRLGLLARHPEG